MDARRCALSRRNLLAGGGVMGAASLAACGTSGPSGGRESGTGVPPPAAGAARLQLWYQLTGSQAEHLATVNGRFTGEHPGIEVELVTVPEAEMTVKLTTALAAGLPEVSDPDLLGRPGDRLGADGVPPLLAVRSGDGLRVGQ